MKRVDAAAEHEVLMDLVNRFDDLSQVPEDALRMAIAESCGRLLFDASWTLVERQDQIRALYNRLRGLDILQPLLDDSSISEIMINGPDTIFIERAGRLEHVDLRFRDEDHLMQVMRQVYSGKNRALSITKPSNDVRLDDGSRVHGMIWPLTPDGPVFNIRKFNTIKPDAETLIASGFIPEAIFRYLDCAVKERRSIFICGGTGSGKTTLLNILSHSIDPNERVITIEDSCELQLQDLPNLVRLECHASGGSAPAYDIGQLIRHALRMRPDRIIVGEVRGHEAADMLEAMNTGHPGTLSTGHGNSCADMARRLANLVLAATRLPYEVILENIAAAFDLFVHLKREADGSRFVTEVVETSGFSQRQILYRTIYRRNGEPE